MVSDESSIYVTKLNIAHWTEKMVPRKWFQLLKVPGDSSYPAKIIGVW